MSISLQVTDGNISVSGATGPGGVFRIGDVVTVTWDNSLSGDGNPPDWVGNVTADFSEFGGGAAVQATNTNNVWTAVYTIVAGDITAHAPRNVSVTATDVENEPWSASDTTNAYVDNIAPVVTDGAISISGGGGPDGDIFKVGDTVTVLWKIGAGGDALNDTLGGVTADFSAFGGSSEVEMTYDSLVGGYVGAYTLTAEAPEGTDKNVSVTASDWVGNKTTTADTTDAVVDVSAPEVASIERQTPDSASTNADALVWRVTFNEAVQNVNVYAFAVGGGTSATVTDVSPVGVDGKIWTVTVSGEDLADFEGDVTLSFAPAQDIEDLAGNALVETTPTEANEDTYQLDNTPPAVPAFTSMEVDDGSLVFSGTGEAGSTVVLRPLGGGTEFTTATVEDGGTWSATVALGALSTGVNSFEILARDTSLNESAVATGIARFQNDTTGALLEGGTGNDLLLGNVGDDTIKGGAGVDLMNGADGADTVDYSGSSAGVQVNLATGAADGGDAAGDTLVGIENLFGSAHDDILTGDGGSNRIEGGAGADTIKGGAGDDTLLGEGADRLSYAGTSAGVQVDLANNSTSGGDAAGDSILGFEHVIGSDHGDTLVGTDGANELVGGAGGDVLEGGAGNDWLRGNDGNDTIVGHATGSDDIKAGDGTDLLDYRDVDANVEFGLDSFEGDRFTGYIAKHDTCSDSVLGVDKAVGFEEITATDGDADTINGQNFHKFDEFASEIANAPVTVGAGLDIDLTAGTGGVRVENEAWAPVFSELAFKISGFEVFKGAEAADRILGGTHAGAVTIDGAGGNDTLQGGTGNDLLIGGLGADSLDGGDGLDTVDYSGASCGVAVDLQEGLAWADGSFDQVASLETVIGTCFDDSMRGTSEDELLVTGAGDDLVLASGGADTILAGSGFDFVSYQADTEGVVVSLDPWIGNDGMAAGQLLIGVEGLVGGSGDDWLIGDVTDSDCPVDNVLIGDSGDDTLDGGMGADSLAGGQGADLLIGGAGWDVAYYGDSDEGVVIDLAAGTGKGGSAEGDILLSIEEVEGSYQNDKLLGDAGNNRLDGDDGDDTLSGGAGKDTLDGGCGIDTASYAGASSGVTVSLDNRLASTGDAAGDRLYEIENLEGSAFTDGLYGDTGCNVLSGLAGNDALYGMAGDDTLIGGLGADAMHGDVGFDIASYEFASNAVRASLAARKNSFTNGGEATGDTYIQIEGLRGSNFSDVLVGSSGDNLLEGRLGADTLDGGEGNDSLAGGAGGDSLVGGGGSDWADYEVSTRGVSVNLATGIGNGGHAQGDTLVGIENLFGSAYGDTLTGDTGANILVGAEGNDLLSGGAGNDTLDGGDGLDTASYANDTAGFLLDLQATSCATGAAAGDELISIEGVIGGSGNDTLRGDAASNVLSGNAGNDLIEGRDGGDTLNGGAGIDTVSYESSGVPVELDLAGGAATLAGGNDVVSGFENAIGGLGDDTLRGSTAANLLVGGSGNDQLLGGAGADTLVGQSGNNLLDGGEGGDLAVYTEACAITLQTSPADLTVQHDDGIDTLVGIETVQADSGSSDYISGQETTRSLEVNLGANTLRVLNGSSAELSLTVLGFEHALGGDAADTLVGSTADNLLAGNGANDELHGLEGADTLDGGAGDDMLSGGLGADSLVGGDGNDRASYRTSAEGVRVDLASGEAALGDAAGDTLIGIENLEGSAFADTLTGNNGANHLIGNAGDDILTGGASADTLHGGAGQDEFIYTGPADFDATEAVNGGNGYDTILFAGSGGETLVLSSNVSGVEEARVAGGSLDLHINAALANGTGEVSLIGNTGNNQLTGNDLANLLVGEEGSDTLTGGAGADTLIGSLGADHLDGGVGSDWVSYLNSSLGVSVNLADTVQVIGEAEGDVLTSVENVMGSAHADFIRGNGEANFLSGSAGDDSLQGFAGDDVLEGGGGQDELIGGLGYDRVTYRASAAGVNVDLAQGFGVGGEAEGDTYLGIEAATGSAHNDTLIGNHLDNRMEGGAGDDSLVGGSGADTLLGGDGSDALFGGAGADLLRGGSGADVFIYTDVSQSDAAAWDSLQQWDMADVIDLSQIDANTTLAGDQAFVFRGYVGNAPGTIAAGDIWAFQIGNRTVLLAGTDADAAAELRIEIAGHHTLTDANFIL